MDSHQTVCTDIVEIWFGVANGQILSGGGQMVLTIEQGPAILVAGKGRGGMFLFLVSSLSFPFFFLPWSSLSSFLLLFSYPWETTQNYPKGLICL